MMARRLFRAAVRPIKRACRPLRLLWLDYQRACSVSEIERLLNLRDDLNRCKPGKHGLAQRRYLNQLEQIEHLHLVRLDKRRQELIRWEA